jgi:ribose 5-phosphate isomerase A
MNSTNLSPQDLGKKAAGEQAVVDLVRPGMKLGLGTGSTAYWAIKKTGELFRAGLLADILVVPTSFDTEILCQQEGLAVRGLGDRAIDGHLDLYLDGADEVDPALHCIKGGGAAQLQEKIVCDASAKFVIVADESKVVPHLGTKFPIPVEIHALARVNLIRSCEALGAKAVLRYGKGKAGPVVTDNGNLVLDLTFGSPVNCAEMAAAIKLLTGVIEVGLFPHRASAAYIGKADGSCQILRKP